MKSELDKITQWIASPLPMAQRLFLRSLMWGTRKLKGFREELIEGLEKLKVGLAQETDQTREMLEIYRRQALGEATPEEMKIANAQFRDVIKGMGLGVLLVLPFSPVTLPLIVKLGRAVGIEVLPDSFRDDHQSEQEQATDEPGASSDPSEK